MLLYRGNCSGSRDGSKNIYPYFWRFTFLCRIGKRINGTEIISGAAKRIRNVCREEYLRVAEWINKNAPVDAQ